MTPPPNTTQLWLVGVPNMLDYLHSPQSRHGMWPDHFTFFITVDNAEELLVPVFLFFKAFVGTL